MERFFKAYDIRGVYPRELSEEHVYCIGEAIEKAFRPKRVVIGYDMRTSSHRFLQELIFALGDKAHITVIGKATTPLLDFSAIYGRFDLGIIITASHSPAEYGGMKLTRGNGLPIAEGYGMEALRKAYVFKKHILPMKPPKVEHASYVKDYLRSLPRNLNPKRRLNVVVDYGNGMVHHTARHIWHELNLNVIELYKEPDGTFPNHVPNPVVPENMRALQRAVLKHKADIGIAFDGDGDRVGFVDEKGRLVQNDLAALLLALQEVRLGNTIYHDLRFRKVFDEAITKAGGISKSLRVGNPYYKIAVLQQGGLIGMEYSGHHMYREHFAIDDGLFAGLKMLQLLSWSTKSMSQLLKPYEKEVLLPEVSLPLKGDYQALLESIKQHYSHAAAHHIDGLTIEGKDFRFTIRKSNTEPVLRMTVSAKSRAKATQVKKQLLAIVGRQSQA